MIYIYIYIYIYVINLSEYKSVRSQWIALYMNGENVISFDSFGVEYTKQIKKIIGSKNI